MATNSDTRSGRAASRPEGSQPRSGNRPHGGADQQSQTTAVCRRDPTVRIENGRHRHRCVVADQEDVVQSADKVGGPSPLAEPAFVAMTADDYGEAVRAVAAVIAASGCLAGLDCGEPAEVSSGPEEASDCPARRPGS